MIHYAIDSQSNKIKLVSCENDGSVTEINQLNSISEIPIISKKDKLIAVLSGDQVLIHQIKLPRMSASKLLKAIPFALEEYCSQPIEKYHFALGEKSLDNEYVVASILKSHFDDFYHRFKVANRLPDIIIPEFMILPHAQNTWKIFVGDDHTFIRINSFFGFSCDPSNIDFLINKALSEQQQIPEEIFIYRNNDFSLQLKKIDHKKPKLKYLGNDAMIYNNFQSNDFLSFTSPSYPAEKKGRLFFNRWKHSVSISIMLLAATIFIKFTNLTILQHRVSALKQQQQKIYEQIFGPNEKTLYNPQSVTQRLSQLSSYRKQHQFSNIVVKLSIIFSKFQEIMVDFLSYNNNKLILKIHSTQLSKIQKLTHLLTSQGLTIQQRQLIHHKNKTFVELIIYENQMAE